MLLIFVCRLLPCLSSPYDFLYFKKVAIIITKDNTTNFIGQYQANILVMFLRFILKSILYKTYNSNLTHFI